MGFRLARAFAIRENNVIKPKVLVIPEATDPAHLRLIWEGDTVERMSIVSRDSASSSLLGISGFNSERILDEKVEILISKTRNFVRSLITRSTILSLLPLLLWWLIFQLNIYVPFHLRPTIHIRLLPWLEETFFGVPGMLYCLKGLFKKILY